MHFKSFSIDGGLGRSGVADRPRNQDSGGGEPRFAALTAGAAPARESEFCRQVHEMIVTSVRTSQTSRPVMRNKKVYICSLVVIAMLAASPMRAADRSGTSTLLAPQTATAKVSLVKVDRRTGRLVRAVAGGEPPVAVKFTPPPAHIQRLIEQSARAHNVDPLLVQSVIQTESNYNHYAVSPKGAEGLMQLMPGTARTLGVGNSFDPAQNIEAGVKYLQYLQTIYTDDRLALAAYNAGPKAVEKYKQVPPYAETQNYVAEVGKRYQVAKRNEAARTASEQAAAAQADDASAPVLEQESQEQNLEEHHPRLEEFTDENGRLVLRTAPR